MDCVGCTACIDACDEVMEKVGFRKGLIRYASERQIGQNKPFSFTPKMKGYSIVLLILLGAMSFMITTRDEVDTHITRVKGQLFQEVDEYTISNLFEAKIINKSSTAFPVELRLEGHEGKIKQIGAQVFELKPESINDFTFFLEMPKKEIHERNNPITIGIYRNNKKIQTIKTKFLGPFQ
jgi:polyferredoxin